jgi:hypothetical protein
MQIIATPLPSEIRYRAAYLTGMGNSWAMPLAHFDQVEAREYLLGAQMSPAAGFNTAEAAMAQALEAEGYEVEALEVIQGQPNPDAMVTPPGGSAGVAEFKTVTVNGTNTLKNQIQEGLKKAATVVVDVRGTSLSKAQVLHEIGRVEGNMGSIQNRVIVLTSEGIVKH